MVQGDWMKGIVNRIIGAKYLETRHIPPHVLLELREGLEEIRDVGAVILFGSVARGKAGEKSDIDLMVVPLKPIDPGSLRRKVNEVLIRIERDNRLPLSFSSVIHNGDEDPNFLWEVARDGIVLFSRTEMFLGKIKKMIPRALISYTYKGLSGAEKKRLQRYLFENKSGPGIDRNDRREYLAPGVVMLDIVRGNDLVNYLESNGMEFSIHKVWI